MSDIVTPDYRHREAVHELGCLLKDAAENYDDLSSIKIVVSPGNNLLMTWDDMNEQDLGELIECGLGVSE